MGHGRVEASPFKVRLTALRIRGGSLVTAGGRLGLGQGRRRYEVLKKVKETWPARADLNRVLNVVLLAGLTLPFAHSQAVKSISFRFEL